MLSRDGMFTPALRDHKCDRTNHCNYPRLPTRESACVKRPRVSRFDRTKVCPGTLIVCVAAPVTQTDRETASSCFDLTQSRAKQVHPSEFNSFLLDTIKRIAYPEIADGNTEGEGKEKNENARCTASVRNATSLSYLQAVALRIWPDTTLGEIVELVMGSLITQEAAARVPKETDEKETAPRLAHVFRTSYYKSTIEGSLFFELDTVTIDPRSGAMLPRRPVGFVSVRLATSKQQQHRSPHSTLSTRWLDYCKQSDERCPQDFSKESPPSLDDASRDSVSSHSNKEKRPREIEPCSTNGKVDEKRLNTSIIPICSESNSNTMRTYNQQRRKNTAEAKVPVTLCFSSANSFNQPLLECGHLQLGAGVFPFAAGDVLLITTPSHIHPIQA